jgi:hypothetical protein
MERKHLAQQGPLGGRKNQRLAGATEEAGKKVPSDGGQKATFSAACKAMMRITSPCCALAGRHSPSRWYKTQMSIQRLLTQRIVATIH